MKNQTFLALTITCTLTTGVCARDLSADTINNASIDAISADRPVDAGSAPDPSMIRLQVLLDRVGSSPGVIDGLYGENVSKAIEGFEAMAGLPVDGEVDANLLAQLGDTAPVVGPYVITAQDGQDIVEKIPEDYAEQAVMKQLGYTSVAERLSERFHMDIDLLKTLNPGSTFAQGDTVFVAKPGTNREGHVRRIEARTRSGQVYAFSKDDRILAVYPATIGSHDNPTPTGSHDVNGVVHMPDYTYNPKVNFKQGKNQDVLMLPGGPNNPVGTVWIDLSEPTYGIHGTPEPSAINKVGSHGCVRLANWDVEELAAMVKPGVRVDIVD